VADPNLQYIGYRSISYGVPSVSLQSVAEISPLVRENSRSGPGDKMGSIHPEVPVDGNGPPFQRSAIPGIRHSGVRKG